MALTEDGTCWIAPVSPATAVRISSSCTCAAEAVVTTSPSASSVTVLTPSRIVAS